MDKEKQIHINAFKKCMNILRDNEGLTGDKALRNLSYLLILKLIEPQFDKGIDIDTYDFGEHNETILKMVRFSNLSKIEKGDIPNIMECLWKEILSVHPTTRHVFMPEKFFDIQYASTYKKLIDVIDSLDFSQSEYNDILGNAYEEVIQDIMTGKVLGQFFTQPLIRNMMVELINPQIYPDGTIDTCCDPTMGTGGFLITFLKHILKQANEKEIAPDWEFIRKEGLYGKELDLETYQLAISNMLISTGYMFETLEKGDSLRVPITRKFDSILANPPFGIKGLHYDDCINKNMKNASEEYLPIRTNNGVSLFLQAIVFMLKIGGKGAVVLPNGQELFSRSKVHISLREYLLRTCDLREVIYLPEGMFTYTPIKTCVFFFVKKAKVSTTTLQTKEIKFYDYDPHENKKMLLGNVSMDKIESNAYSLNYSEYYNIKEKDDYGGDMIIIKTLGEVCNFRNGKAISKKYLVEGEYPVIGGGQKPMGYHNDYNVNENTILCSSSGAYAGFISKYEKHVWASDCFAIIPKDDSLNNMYLYYLLKKIQDKIYKLQSGTAQPHVYSKNLSQMKIPIPPIDKQREIIETIILNEKTIKELEYEIDQRRKAISSYIL
jgi:type I restriction-modification system DNA methylase subunit